MAKWLKNTITLIVGTILGGLLYRMGGAAGYNTKFRDFGIPTVAVLVFLIFCFPKYNLAFLSLILTWGATFAVQTTYWKKKGTDAKWWNWLLTGLGYSICWLPTVLALSIWPSSGLNAHWLGFGIRSVVCTGLTVGVSQFFGNAVWEENARGWVEIVTIPLLFIG